MPELPEVETIRTGLSPVLVGLKIKTIKTTNNKSFVGDNKKAIGSTITRVSRRGKNLIISFNNNFTLLVHLKMTGQLIYRHKMVRVSGGHPTKDWPNQMPGKHTRVIITLSNNSKLYFNDLRKFGWIKVLDVDQLKTQLNGLGPEPLSNTFSSDYLKNVADRFPNKMIKAVLLNQALVSGIGNIYSDEALYLAKVHPQSKLKSLNLRDFDNIVKSVKTILSLAIKHGGTTSSDFLNADGKKGEMQNFLQVYGRKGNLCPICQSEIKKIKLNGRGTHFCPRCQDMK